MSRILAIETATEACSAALLVDGEVHERFEVAPRQHAALLLPFVEALLADAGLLAGQLDAVAFGRGPGSFTGLRIAAAMTQGIAFGAGLPVVPVSTLAALALGAVREQGATAVLAALDARMSEVYWGAYRRAADGLVEAAGPEGLCAPQALRPPHEDRWSGAGSGWERYAGVLAGVAGVDEHRIHGHLKPHAADIARLAVSELRRGRALAPEQALPVYLRNQVAAQPKPKG
ncbi:MAG TPA: tRNA (adenosine(37)-N6)-threonylcarbamoyltransferase complex dimerization subunit type 1 TsaB [Gammaproteobacteria bacterium]|nr:tRNA (adenosine(37)-N6)-threonylcarbamoyltransferase complex dimerization subunit type 1 TsaB [Gammaproteobacteria bacterium]